VSSGALLCGSTHHGTGGTATFTRKDTVMRDWRFSAGLAALWLVVAVLGVASAPHRSGRVALTFDCLLIFFYAFQAGARLDSAGLSDRARWWLGIRSRDSGSPDN
jgi:hypothetical protein